MAIILIFTCKSPCSICLVTHVSCSLFPSQVIGLNTYNEYSVWRLDRDYCSDESGHSAEYKLGVQQHRLPGEEERRGAKTIQRREKDECSGFA